ncbi:MAG: hypothetical protein F6K14_28810 [Symploca sp. SIO2C1]|nr:hypothetical protein [Symploca sp. SIO2C1]
MLNDSEASQPSGKSFATAQDDVIPLQCVSRNSITTSSSTEDQKSEAQ